MKSAIHVKSDIAWQECSYTLRYSQTDSLKSMVPIYQSLINGGNNLNILVYSGDDDSVCGTVGTQNWIWDMGYSAGPTNTWSEYSLDSQTVGYITKWTKQKLAFVTVNYRVYNNIHTYRTCSYCILCSFRSQVHGAGHEVPAYKPEVALDLFTKYLQGYWTS